VVEALRHEGRVNRVYLAKDGKVRGRNEILDLAKASKTPFDFVPLAKLNELVGDRDHQGVAAALSPVEYLTVDDFLGVCPSTAMVVVLDQVQNPKNVGMIIRTAAGAGAAGVILPARGGAGVDPTVITASAGAAFHVPLVRCTNVAQTLRDLRDGGFWSYGLDGRADQGVFGVDWAVRTAVVLGNESEGLRPAVRKACDELVAIPLAHGVESLNVAVAAGVALFQIKAQSGA